MIHITPSKAPKPSKHAAIGKKATKQFFVTTKSSHNGKKLSSTETVKKKQGAWKNIIGQMKVWNSPSVYVQDNTGPKPVVYKYHSTGNKIVVNKKPEKAPNVK